MKRYKVSFEIKVHTSDYEKPQIKKIPKAIRREIIQHFDDTGSIYYTDRRGECILDTESRVRKSTIKITEA